MSIEEQLGVKEPTAIVEQAVDSKRAEQVKKQISKLIKAESTTVFDLAELLYEVKSKNYHRAWGFDTFSAYAKTLELKVSKSYYLVRIVENMNAAGLTREQYEPVGRGKLRVISRLDPSGEYNGQPMSQVIKELTLKAGQLSLEEVTLEVDSIQGKVQDNSMVWLNLHLVKSVRDNVVRPAIERAKKHAPQKEDPDEPGHYLDVSDGAAIELICANFLADPNFAEPEIEELTPTVATAKENGTFEPTMADILIPSDEVIEKLMGEGVGDLAEED